MAGCATRGFKLADLTLLFQLSSAFCVSRKNAEITYNSAVTHLHLHTIYTNVAKQILPCFYRIFCPCTLTLLCVFPPPRSYKSTAFWHLFILSVLDPLQLWRCAPQPQLIARRPADVYLPTQTPDVNSLVGDLLEDLTEELSWKNSLSQTSSLLT